MSGYAYPRTAVIADGARATAGLALAGAPLAFGDIPGWQTLFLGLIASVFALYAAASLCRAISRIDVSEDGISLRGPWRTRLPWSEVDRLRVAYYTTWRDGGGGWMQLTLAGPGRRVVIDSRIAGFDLLARRAVAAACQRALRLDPATLANLRARHRHGAEGVDRGRSAMTDLLRVRDLRVEFHTQAGVVRALDGLSFRLRVGSAVALVGESGSGKSVTAQAILGLLPRTGRITGGEILLNDPGAPDTIIDLARLDPDSRKFRAVRGDHISMIFQEPMSSLSPLHTIGDQVSEALFLHRPMSRSEGRDVTLDMLRLVGFPDPERAYAAYPFEFSGGLRQRAMIAVALICRPAILIADEPSTALDVTIQAQILKLIVDLQAELGMALLLISHDLGVVANVAEEVVVMYRGRVMESGALEDIYRDPRHPYLKALLRAVPHFDMKPNERLVPLREICHHEGHLLSPRRDAAWAKVDAPLLEVRNLTKTFTGRGRWGLFGARSASRFTAVDDVSFAIRRGCCLGLVGESGCGKTTVSKIVMRAIGADAGQVLYNAGDRLVDVLALEGNELIAFRRKIQYVFQDPFSSLNPRMTVFDILSEPLLVHGDGNEAYRRGMVCELMNAVGLDPRHLRRYPHSFSGGQRQRIGIARALALRPEILICDEPVSALDVSVQAQILNLLKELQKSLELTYLFISHNLAVVDYMADDIAVMCAGAVVEQAPRELLFRAPVHPYTQALLAAVPYPDPDRKLDFDMLMDGRASTPSAWSPPFNADGEGPPELFDLGDGHFVRAHSHPSPARRLVV